MWEFRARRDLKEPPSEGIKKHLRPFIFIFLYDRWECGFWSPAHLGRSWRESIPSSWDLHFSGAENFWHQMLHLHARVAGFYFILCVKKSWLLTPRTLTPLSGCVEAAIINQNVTVQPRRHRVYGVVINIIHLSNGRASPSITPGVGNLVCWTPENTLLGHVETA